jgi:hypothetical protein
LGAEAERDQEPTRARSSLPWKEWGPNGVDHLLESYRVPTAR